MFSLSAYKKIMKYDIILMAGDMMRDEEQILDMILQVAQKDNRIRLVFMNGSRVNMNVHKDVFQDYDIVFVVEDMQSFLDNPTWIDIFGKCIIKQEPEGMVSFPHDLEGWYTYLMLFEDGNRIDLMLLPIEDLNRYLDSDTLTKVLLDKDEVIEEAIIASDQGYYIKKPTAVEFEECCNEFWWITTYIVKAIKRNEFFYASEHMNLYLRSEVLKMLSWNVGFTHNFQVNVGKCYKYLDHYLPLETLQQVKDSYDIKSIKHCEITLISLVKLFRSESKLLADRLQYLYPDYDIKVSAYIHRFIEED